MATRLAHTSKLKSSSRRKSPTASRSTTPNTSQSSIPSDAKDALVDDVLQGDEIEALRVKEEKLKELILPKCPTSRKPAKLQKVLVKSVKRDFVGAKSQQRSVAVLHPMPSGAKPCKTKTLGVPKPGPRFREDGTFIAHSILGTVDDYSDSLLFDNKSSMAAALSVIPPISSGDSSKASAVSKRKDRSLPLVQETNALLNWEKQMNARKQAQKKLATSMATLPNKLVMHHGDEYRQKQEQKSLIDRAIPPLDAGKGYYVGSEFWRPPIAIGDDLTGIRTTLTQSERGQHPPAQFIGVPDVVKTEQGLTPGVCAYPHQFSWYESEYLQSRMKQLGGGELRYHQPDMAQLQVVGRSSQSIPTVATSSVPLQYSTSLDSLGEPRSDSSSDEEREEILNERDSFLDAFPDVVSPPSIGPALKLNGELLRWEGGADGGRGDEAADSSLPPPIDLKLLFEEEVNSTGRASMQMENCGTAAIYYSWKPIAKPNPLGTGQAGQTQRFYFDSRASVIVPGQKLPVLVMFKSANPGLFSEQWMMETRPCLSRGAPIILSLRGIAFQEDKYQEKRNQLEEKLDRLVTETMAKKMVNYLVQGICTPPRCPSPAEVLVPEEADFLQKNPGVYYHYNIVHQLKSLYQETLSPPSSEPAMLEVPGKTAGKKPKDERQAGRDDKKFRASIDATSAEEQATKPTDDIPLWDLSLLSLQNAIMNIEDDMSREQKLSALCSAVSGLSVPPPLPPPPTIYSTIYTLLCGTVDQLAEGAIHLRQVMGLPSQTSGQPMEETPPDADAQVSSTWNASPVPTGKREKRGSKQKDKEPRPSSRAKASATSKKKSQKGMSRSMSKTNLLEAEKDTPGAQDKVPDIDPVLESKYKDNLHVMAYQLIADAVERLAAVTELALRT